MRIAVLSFMGETFAFVAILVASRLLMKLSIAVGVAVPVLMLDGRSLFFSLPLLKKARG